MPKTKEGGWILDDEEASLGYNPYDEHHARVKKWLKKESNDPERED